MLEHHKDIRLLYQQSLENAREYLVPFVEKTKKIDNINILDIGCGEGGVLHAFAEKGARGIGIELDQVRIDKANEFEKEFIGMGRLSFINQNIYDESFLKKYSEYFDLIILKDVIEHIPAQEKFIPYLAKLLKPKGQVFFGFPPWQMPFGGHQQLLKSKWGSKIPYYHLLPMPVYVKLLKQMKESSGMIDEMKEIKETGISLERFERIIHQSPFKIVNKQWYLINPIYRYKFGIKPRKQNRLLGAIPGLRNFFTTCGYYTIEKVS